jgi:hypothetical protein
MTDAELRELRAEVTRLLEQRGARREGEELRFPCPKPEHHANGDAHWSARWHPEKGVWRCDVSGEGDGTLNLRWLLHMDGRARRNGTGSVNTPSPSAQRARRPDAGRKWEGRVLRETLYPIRDTTGALVAEHVRRELNTGEKHFTWRRNGQPGLGGLKVADLPLYGAHELAAAAPGTTVVLVEGEKTRDALGAMGIFAVATVTGAAGIPSEAVLQVLDGQDVVLWPDADVPGRQHMRRIADRLTVLRIQRRILDPWPQRTNGVDAADFDGTDEELRALLDGGQSTMEGADFTAEGIDVVGLLYAVEGMLRRYIAFADDAQATACALWVLHTYVIEAAEVTPYLHISSPMKRSGKSKLLDVLQELVAQPWRCVEPSTSALFRKVEAQRPTLLLDEVDAVFQGKPTPQTEGLRGVLNAGFERSGVVPRCGGKTYEEVRDFSAFCAKALAGIGSLPGTIADRAIPIRLKRKHSGEPVEKFRRRQVRGEAAPVRDALARWAPTAISALRDATPNVPDALDDRAQDMWEPLLAIADLAGGRWPEAARAAADALHAGRDEGGGVDVALLAAIRAVFDDTGAGRMLTPDLLRALVDRETEPWGGWWGRDVDAVLDGETPRRPAMELARHLKPFEVQPTTIRTHRGRGKGYLRADFEDAFCRYIPQIKPRGRDNVTTFEPQGFEASRPTPVETDVVRPETLGRECLSRRHDLSAKTRGAAENEADEEPERLVFVGDDWGDL